jgi:hypothetical protein
MKPAARWPEQRPGMPGLPRRKSFGMSPALFEKTCGFLPGRPTEMLPLLLALHDLTDRERPMSLSGRPYDSACRCLEARP